MELIYHKIEINSCVDLGVGKLGRRLLLSLQVLEYLVFAHHPLRVQIIAICQALSV